MVAFRNLCRSGTYCRRTGSDSCMVRARRNVLLRAMLLVFRTLSFFALGAILLTPFWFLNNTLDRLLPPAPMLSPRLDVENARLRDRFAGALDGLKQDIRADMCRHPGRRLCVLTVCLPAAEPRAPRCR
jgi:hypothetical protein